MKIAIPSTNENIVDSHFGHCEFYQIYTVSDEKEITEIQILDAPSSCGCKSNIAVTLQTIGVNVMLAGGIGQGAIDVLSTAGIEVVRGCSGNIETLIDLYLKGQIADGGSTCQHNHNHEEGCNH